MIMSTYPNGRAPEIFRLLANDLRWQLIVALARSDLKVQELAARTDRPQNLVSYHLKELRAAELVVERRSSADARATSTIVSTSAGSATDCSRVGKSSMQFWEAPVGHHG